MLSDADHGLATPSEIAKVLGRTRRLKPVHRGSAVKLGENPVVQLEPERKIITDTLKMVAYRAETQLANLVGPLLPYKDNEALKFMRQVSSPYL